MMYIVNYPYVEWYECERIFQKVLGLLNVDLSSKSHCNYIYDYECDAIFFLFSKVEYRKKNTSPDSNTSLDVENGYDRITSAEELLTKFEQYGSTPPRTRIKIKNRDWERRKGYVPSRNLTLELHFLDFFVRCSLSFLLHLSFLSLIAPNFSISVDYT